MKNFVANHRKLSIVLAIVVSVIVICCFCVIAAMIYNQTPSGQAAITQRAAIAQTTEAAPTLPNTPTNTKGPSATPKPTETPQPTNTPKPSDTPESSSTPKPELFMGDAVSEYGYALTGISIIDPATPGTFYKATAGKKLIAVEVIISNLSGDMFGVNPLNATLVDKEGFTYACELGGVDDQLSTLDLNPGEKVRGFIGFEVPDTAVAASIKYAVAMFGNDILQASLNPAPEGHVAIAEPPSTPGNPFPKLGEAVENYGYSLSAVTVENPAKPGPFVKLKVGYKVVAVEIILGNVSGDETLSVNPLYAYLVDSDGFVYSAELGGSKDQIDTGDLGIGEKSKGWVAFVVPEKSTPASIKYATKPFAGNYLQTGVVAK